MGKWGWLPLIGSILGALVFILGFVAAEGAPQEAVAAAAGAALAIIPYVFARAISELNASEVRNLRQAELARPSAREVTEGKAHPISQRGASEARPQIRSSYDSYELKVQIRHLQSQVVAARTSHPDNEELRRIRQDLSQVWLELNREQDIQHSQQRFERLQEEFSQLESEFQNEAD